MIPLLCVFGIITALLLWSYFKRERSNIQEPEIQPMDVEKEPVQGYGVAQSGSLILDSAAHGDLAKLSRGLPPPLHFHGKPSQRRARAKRRKHK